VQSQRYVNQANQQIVIPESVERSLYGENAELAIKNCMNLYNLLVENGVPEEDARYVLPQGITTKLIMTMNCRELLHFFSLRTCNRAQWEIRQLADEMLEICRKRCPAIFANAGPGCVRGHCPEKRPCGHTRASVGKENNDG
jgi:thymidylate synthase (FAD)